MPIYRVKPIISAAQNKLIFELFLYISSNKLIVRANRYGLKITLNGLIVLIFIENLYRILL
jgi:hypothetical protein